MATSIPQRIAAIEGEIPEKVRLIAISKKVSVAAMLTAYEAGIRDFGESRWQEAASKQKQLEHLQDICWHFIGHVQKNKARKIIENFSWIHSVDSLALALRLDALAGELSRSPQVYLQVKPLPDPNKYGWEIPELRRDLEQLNACQHLKIRGLMAILPWGLAESEALTAFQTVQQLAQEISAQNYANLPMQELSMGMSGDYLLAIKAGATAIRLGRTIFGERE